jgi:hypothetical protein
MKFNMNSLKNNTSLLKALFCAVFVMTIAFAAKPPTAHALILDKIFGFDASKIPGPHNLIFPGDAFGGYDYYGNGNHGGNNNYPNYPSTVSNSYNSSYYNYQNYNYNYTYPSYSYPSYNYSYPSYNYSYPNYNYSYPSYSSYYSSYNYNYSNPYYYGGYGCVTYCQRSNY